ncbi:MAG: hypothetical protein WCF36_04755 [Candidatus Nanopelagicales bacterium]
MSTSPEDPHRSRFTDTRGATEHLLCSDRTLDRYAARGLLTKYRTPGGRLRWDLDELDALLTADSPAEAS